MSDPRLMLPLSQGRHRFYILSALTRVQKNLEGTCWSVCIELFVAASAITFFYLFYRCAYRLLYCFTRGLGLIAFLVQVVH